MSLQRKSLPAIPPETVQVAKAVFPSGSVYMQMRDELGSIYDDELRTVGDGESSYQAQDRRAVAGDG